MRLHGLDLLVEGVALASSAASLVVVWATNLSAFSRAARMSVSTRPVWRLMKGPAGFWPLGLIGGGSVPLNPPAAPPAVRVGVVGRWSPRRTHYSRLDLLPPLSRSPSQSLERMGATFAVAVFSLAALANPVRCWKTTLGVKGVLDLSLIHI